MSKFDLPVRKKVDKVIVPDVVYETSRSPVNSCKNKEKLSANSYLNEKNVGVIINIIGNVGMGLIDIKKIKVNGSVRLEELNKQIQLTIINAETESKAKQEDSAQWHSKFDKKRDLLLNIISHIEKNPEFTSEYKQELILIVKEWFV